MMGNMFQLTYQGWVRASKAMEIGRITGTHDEFPALNSTLSPTDFPHKVSAETFNRADSPGPANYYLSLSRSRPETHEASYWFTGTTYARLEN